VATAIIFWEGGIFGGLMRFEVGGRGESMALNLLTNGLLPWLGSWTRPVQ